MSKYRLKVPSKRDRIRALLNEIPNDVGRLPEGEIDAEEMGGRGRVVAVLEEERQNTTPSEVACLDSRVLVLGRPVPQFCRAPVDGRQALK